MVIDGLQFARCESELTGVIAPESLPRLAETGCQVGDIRFRLYGGTNERGKLSLHFVITGTIDQACQRCLQPVQFLIQLGVDLELSRSRDEIKSADDDVDRILATRKMIVEELVEDEILLALPMIPRHEQCAAFQDNREAVEEEFEPAKPASAFSLLASLSTLGKKR